MAGTFGRSFFGEVTARLQRLLDLDGVLPIELSKNITPVALVADGTLPGYGDQRLRRFGGSCQLGAPAATGGMGWTCTHGKGVIITAMMLSPTAATSFSISYQGPLSAFPWPMASATAFLIDRTNSIETAPMLSGVLANPPEPPGVIWRSEVNATASKSGVGLPPFFMMEGSKLCCHTSAPVGGEFSIFGMLL